MDIEKLEICGQRLEREQYGNLTRIPRFLGYYTVRGNSNFLEKLELTTPRLIIIIDESIYKTHFYKLNLPIY
jgi:hypothetical protein